MDTRCKLVNFHGEKPFRGWDLNPELCLWANCVSTIVHKAAMLCPTHEGLLTLLFCSNSLVNFEFSNFICIGVILHKQKMLPLVPDISLLRSSPLKSKFFLKQLNLSTIRYKCYHLRLCLHLFEPNLQSIIWSNAIWLRFGIKMLKSLNDGFWTWDS